jgi:predicted DCC family thiol-disulfide oxidoreductase YuxK
MNAQRFLLLYDGKCPICLGVTGWLRRHTIRPELSLMDIRASEFDPSKFGLTFEQVTGVIHGIQEDGTILKGMAAIRQAYHKTRWGWLIAITGWPILRPIFDALYGWVSRHRAQLSRLLHPMAGDTGH